MINKNTIIGGITGCVAFFLLGWLIYGILLKNFYSSQMLISGMNKEIPDFLWLIIGNFASGLLLAIILNHWAKATTSVEGFKVALIIGLLLGTGFDLTMFATANIMTLNGALVDIGVTAVMTGIVGAVITPVMKMRTKTVSA